MTPEKAAKRHPVCEKVPEHGQLAYFSPFDAKGCIECDEWREEKCGDPDCRFCPARPDRPSLLVGP